jgi:hypothetical protein
MPTLKQVGDIMRGKLKDAQASGALPRLRYNVRVSNSRKTGPAVNITIEGHEHLVLAYARRWGPLGSKDDEAPVTLADVPVDVMREWRDTDGKALIAKVDMCARRNDWIRH